MARFTAAVAAAAVMGTLFVALPPSRPAVAATATERLSVSTSGGDPNGHTYARDITPDGRFVVMQSMASNLVATSSSGWQIYLRDRADGVIERVSVNDAGAPGSGGSSYWGSVSADGRYVAFESTATNLVAGDTNAVSDVFVRDRNVGTTTRVSVGSGGVQGDKASNRPSISANGRFVAFTSNATNLVAGDTNGFSDVFVHDLQTGGTSLISRSSTGGAANGSSRAPDLSGDGSQVAFESTASNIGGGLYEDVFVHDRMSGTTELISVKDASVGAAGRGVRPSISQDGRFVSYTDYSGKFQVFRTDRATGELVAVSTDAAGNLGADHSDPSWISADGRAVLFDSSAALLPSDTNGYKDAYIRDLSSGVLQRVAISASGTPPSIQNFGGGLSRDGQFAAFHTAEPLVPPDNNNGSDAFLRDRDVQPAWLPDVPSEQTLGIPGQGSAYAYRHVGEQADPVNSALGSFATATVDAGFAAVGVPVTIGRHYNSADPTSGPLGPGWSFSYQISLSDDGTGTVTFHADDGQQVTYARNSDGSYTGAPGVTATLTADGGGGHTLTTKARLRHEFDTTGRLVALLDRNGQGLTLTYGSDGRLASVSGSGRTATFTHDAGLDRLIRVDLPDGGWVGYSYVDGRLAQVRDPAGATTGYDYDAGGRLTSITDANGTVRMRLAYDPATGRATDQWDARGNHTTFGWDAATQTATMTDARGGVWQDVYDGNVLLRRIDPAGNISRYEYDQQLQLTGADDRAGNRTSLFYDSAGNLTSALTPTGSTYTSFNGHNDVTATTNPRGIHVSYDYDAAGNLTTVTRPDPAGGTDLVTTYSYTNDGRGLLAAVTNEVGQATTYTYNSHGDLTTVTTPLGHTTSYEHDAAGRTTSVVDPRGNATGANPADYTTSYSYDPAGRPTTVTDPLGHTTSQTYDPAGQLTSTSDAKGRVITYSYDADGHLTSVQGPDLAIGPTTATYDANGNLASQTDTNGRTVTYTYDLRNQLIGAVGPHGTYHYGYGPTGRRTTMTVPTGATTTLSYDPIGRLSAIDHPGSTSDVTFTYDEHGNRATMTDGAGTVTYTYDALDQLTSVNRGADTFTFERDRTGNVTAVTYPDSTTYTYSYDADHQLASVATGTTTLASYDYDPAGHLTSAALGDGSISTRSYDRAGRLTDLVTAHNGTILTRADYTLDEVGNPTQVIDHTATATTYRYDTLDRLTKVCFGAAVCDATATDFIEWAYDPAGNRTSETRPSGTTTYTYNSADQLTARSGPDGTITYTYNALGQLTEADTRTYSYDTAGRLTSDNDGTTTTTYTYDGDGRRLTTTTGEQTTELLWNPITYDLALERSHSDDATLRRYAYGAGPIGMTVPARTPSDYYYHTDAQGSVLALTDASGTIHRRYAWQPFGQPRTDQQLTGNAPENPILWAGQYREPTSGLYHLRARQYDPATGRFTTLDPAASTAPSASYVYGNTNPMVFSDPLGLFSIRGFVQTINDVARTVGAITGVAAAVAVYVYPPVAPVLAATAAVAGAITAGTSAYLAWDICRGGKGSCDTAIVTAAVDTAAAGFATVGAVAARALPTAPRAAANASDDLPTQLHHFATNKNSVFTPRMQSIADRYGLSLNDAWNTARMPHLGRHPNAYHDFVLRGMQRAAAEAGDDAARFTQLFDQYVRQPVIQNPDLLRRIGWE